MKKLTEPQKAWIAALRSGDYQQGTDRLQSGNQFCCLGVACLIYEKETQNELSRTHNTNALVGTDLRNHGVVIDWLNLIGAAGENNEGLPADSLVNLNDSGYTFEEIADLLEQNPTNYFRQ